MHRVFLLAAVSALLLAIRANGQSVTYNFESGGDQGFGHKFDTDASETFPIDLIGGSNRIRILRNGDFQEFDRQTGDPLDLQYLAMSAASTNEAGYLLSYDWYINTAPGNFGTFLQLGTYVNTGSGYYAQDFPGTGKDVELNGAQLASGSVFSGTVSETFSARGFDLPPAETFFRFGFIINGDGTNATVHFDNISIQPVVPEPTSMALLAAAISASLLMMRRRPVRSCQRGYRLR